LGLLEMRTGLPPETRSEKRKINRIIIVSFQLTKCMTKLSKTITIVIGLYPSVAPAVSVRGDL
jgi:hypothetical protein